MIISSHVRFAEERQTWKSVETVTLSNAFTRIAATSLAELCISTISKRLWLRSGTGG